MKSPGFLDSPKLPLKRKHSGASQRKNSIA